MLIKQEYEITSPHIVLHLGDSYQFECERCGNCCKTPGYFTLEGLKKASEHLNIQTTDFFDCFCEVPLYSTVARPKRINGICVFLDNTNKKTSCKIHEQKPANCKHSPILPKTIAIDDAYKVQIDKDSELALLTSCPGAGKGAPKTLDDLTRQLIEDDLNLQGEILLKIAKQAGMNWFMQVMRLKRMNRLPLQMAEDLKNYVRAAYVV